MKHLLFLTLTLLLSSSSYASEEENQVRMMMERYGKAFSNHNLEETLNYWESNSEYINPTTGKVLEGQDQLKQNFEKNFNEDKTKTLTVKLKQIEFPEKDKAYIKGIYTLNFDDAPEPVEQAFFAVLVKKDGKWLFSKVRQIQLETYASHDHYLKDLEWLIGSWLDQDEDVSILSKVDWQMNKNYLVQDFQMQLYDHEVMKGKQIIGWDPDLKQVVSWIYDSDGGYGTAKWNFKEGKWVVQVIYTLPAGGKASSTQIYAPSADKKSYEWSSINRDIKGQLQPDIEPVKVVREGSI